MPYTIGDESSGVSAVFYSGRDGHVNLVELRRVTHPRTRERHQEGAASHESGGALGGNGGAVPRVSSDGSALRGDDAEASAARAIPTWEAQLKQARQDILIYGESLLEVAPCYCAARFGEHYHVDDAHTVPWADFAQALYTYVHPVG